MVTSKLLKFVPFLMLTLLNLCSLSAQADGGMSGGGGDTATEMRIDEIRADILKWINEGGAKGLDVTDSRLTLEYYISAMSQKLQPHAVIIGSVTAAEEKNTYDPELKVNIDGQPKTCRGFISRNDGLAHILCSVERFAHTPESMQYSLIHHEYAGLARVERNQGASSDYTLSKQITDYLVPQTVMKLAVQKPLPAKTEEQVPQLAKIARDVWQAILENKLLLPKEIQAAITARSEFGLFEVKVQTQLAEFSGGREDQQKFRLVPIWMSVAFDPAHPGNLAYARLRSAIVEASITWNGGGANARVFDGTAMVGLDGATRTRITGLTFAGGEVHQYLDITSGGSVQLYLRGGLNLSLSADSIRTMDLGNDQAALLIGEGGVRLMKQLLIRGKAQLNGFQVIDDRKEDRALKGLAPAYGGGVEWQLKRHLNIHGDFLRVDTSNLQNNAGTKSVNGAMFGVQINFW